MNEIGAIFLISSSHNIDELMTKKINQHGDNILLSHYHYRDFLADNRKIILPGTLKKRTRSASSGIKLVRYSSISNPVTKVRLGDIVVSDGITQYDFVKETLESY